MSTTQISFSKKKEYLEAMPDYVLLSIGMPQVRFFSMDERYYALCPFHKDTHLGSFSYNPARQTWKCFACGEGGRGAFSLIMKVNDWDFKRTIEYLYDNRNMPASPFPEPPPNLHRKNAANSATLKLKSGRPRKQKGNANLKEFDLNVELSSEDLDAIYRSFAAASPLSSEESSQLQLQRGLYYQSMKTFFSFPVSFNKTFWNRFRMELAKRDNGTNRLFHLLLNVPGFMWDVERECVTFCSFGDAIGILLFNDKGQVNGIEVRVKDKATGQARYLQFSSRGICERNPQRFTHGTGGTFALDFVPAASWCDKVKGIAITEGKFKAIQLAYNKYDAINIHSIQNWKKVLPFLDEQPRNTPIFIALDADCKTNPAVANCAFQLGNAIMEKGFKCYYLSWPAKYGKGVDDVINSGNKSQIRCIPAGKYLETTLNPFLERIQIRKETNASIPGYQ